jgi:hypothetical protein
MNKFKMIRAELIKKYWDAIVEVSDKYDADVFVAFEMLLTNARALNLMKEVRYPIEADVDYEALLEASKAMYKE